MPVGDAVDRWVERRERQGAALIRGGRGGAVGVGGVSGDCGRGT